MNAPVLEIANVSKNYGGLRPLRIQSLTISSGEHVALLGLDQPMAEVLVNLVTGASVPDDGDVRVFGQSTSAIADSAQWLALVDRFGIVSDRAVMLEGMTVVQNLAIPFTLDIEPPSDDARSRAVALAGEAGLDRATWDQPVASLSGEVRARVRLARALALDPAVLLLEHSTAAVESSQAASVAHCVRTAARGRGVAVLALTADPVFARALGGRLLKLDPATGRLNPQRGRGWFRRWLG